MTTAGGGFVAAGGGGVAGGGAGGGVVRVAGGSGCRFALGGASGFGPDDLGGAGSGAGSCASASPAPTANAQHRTISTDARRSNDRLEPLMRCPPLFLPPSVLTHQARQVNGIA